MEGNKIYEVTEFPLNGIKSYNGISFSPDGCTLYITHDIEGHAKILETHYIDGHWSEPILVDVLASEYHDYQPRLSPDGTKLFFNSSRPMPNGEAHKDLRKIWVSELENGKWGPPKFLDGVNSLNPLANDNYPAIQADGSLYYRNAKDSINEDDGSINDGEGVVFFSSYENGTYQSPVTIPELSENVVNDLFVSPGGDIMILNYWLKEEEDVDLYISFKKENGWTSPRKLELLDSPEMELTPTLSPDGLYFLFERRGVTKIISFEALLTVKEKEILSKK